jgi:hypothetical protein
MNDPKLIKPSLELKKFSTINENFSDPKAEETKSRAQSIVGRLEV